MYATGCSSRKQYLRAAAMAITQHGWSCHLYACKGLFQSASYHCHQGDGLCKIVYRRLRHQVLLKDNCSCMTVGPKQHALTCCSLSAWSSMFALCLHTFVLSKQTPVASLHDGLCRLLTLHCALRQSAKYSITICSFDAIKSWPTHLTLLDHPCRVDAHTVAGFQSPCCV